MVKRRYAEGNAPEVEVHSDGKEQDQDGRDGEVQRNVVGLGPNDADGNEENRPQEDGNHLKRNKLRTTSFWLEQMKRYEWETVVLPHHHDQPRNEETFLPVGGADVEKDAGGSEEDAENDLRDDGRWKQKKIDTSHRQKAHFPQLIQLSIEIECNLVTTADFVKVDGAESGDVSDKAQNDHNAVDDGQHLNTASQVEAAAALLEGHVDEGLESWNV